MRRAVAGFCCVVVALEVLIGVPVVVCIGMLTLAQDSGLVVGQTYYAPPPVGPFDPYTPPPLPAAPFSQATISPLPASLPPAGVPEVRQVAVKPWEPMKEQPKSVEPKSVELAAVLPTRAEIGSPLAGTTLDAKNPEASISAFAAAYDEVATSEAESASLAGPERQPCPSASQPSSSGPESESPLVQVPASDCPGPPADPLQAAVERLYELAQQYEAASTFTRADPVRELARQLRQEIANLKAEKSQCAPIVVAEPDASPYPPLPPGNNDPGPVPARGGELPFAPAH
jgi:hypothetical protein